MLSTLVIKEMRNGKENPMEEFHHETVLDYLQSLKGLGPEQFLATYKRPFLVENYQQNKVSQGGNNLRT